MAAAETAAARSCISTQVKSRRRAAKRPPASAAASRAAAAISTSTAAIFPPRAAMEEPVSAGAAGNRCRTWMATPQPIISTFTAARSTPTADTTARASVAVSSSRRAISPSPAARSRRTVRTARPSAADAGVTVRTSP